MRMGVRVDMRAVRGLGLVQDRQTKEIPRGREAVGADVDKVRVGDGHRLVGRMLGPVVLCGIVAAMSAPGTCRLVQVPVPFNGPSYIIPCWKSSGPVSRYVPTARMFHSGIAVGFKRWVFGP
jgi:hypothetical protein